MLRLQVIFEWRLQGEDMSYVDIWEESVPNRGSCTVIAEPLWPDVLEDQYKVSEDRNGKETIVGQGGDG